MTSGALTPRITRSRAAPVTADEVTAAAVELFALRGYRATTMLHIASALGIQAPGLYNHVGSKQEILRNIMVGVMTELLAELRAALESTSEVEEQVRRVIESHVRYHCRHQRATFIGNREIPSLDEPSRSLVIAQRDEFEKSFRSVIDRGIEQGRFAVASARLASYAILEMGMGVASWYREGGELSESQVAYQYGEMALRILRTPG